MRSFRARAKCSGLFAFLAILVVSTNLSLGAVEKAPSAGDVRTRDARMVEPGDVATLDYLCRLKTGEVVASTGAVADAERKSPVFAPGKRSGAVSLGAVAPDDPYPEQLYPGPFELEIEHRLARQVTGMKEGETQRVNLSASMVMPKNEQEGFAYLSRVRTRPKEMTMPKGDYEFRARKAPEVGQEYSYDPAFPGRVTSVTETDVTIAFSKRGDTIETPFGTGRVREEADRYKVDIDAKEGTLVRTGNKIGRITKVDDRVIVIDYRHPFGYEELICDIQVIAVSESEEAGTEVPAEEEQ